MPLILISSIHISSLFLSHSLSLSSPISPFISIYFSACFFLFFFPVSLAASIPTKSTSSTLNGFENLTTDSSGKNVLKFVLTHYIHDTKNIINEVNTMVNKIENKV